MRSGSAPSRLGPVGDHRGDESEHMSMIIREPYSPTTAMLAVLALSLLLPLAAQAADDEEEESRYPQTLEDRIAAVEQKFEADYTEEGTDECLKCHDEDSEFPIFPIFKTKHAVRADERTPFAGKQCEACHGPGGDHAGRVRRGKPRPLMLNFGQDAWTPIATQNEQCLQCHQNHQRIEWKGSTHAFNELSCSACHKVHAEHDPVLKEREQPQVCYACHVQQRAQFYKAFHHPVREGEMACSGCHDVHGGDGSDLMIMATKRQKCTSCHADKRGPFLWEHAPAAEDCTLCHVPHGSSHPALLKKRPPHLCQECHSQSGHPNVRYDGAAVGLGLGPAIGSRGPSRFAAIRGCLNCHSQVHGTNHPSGVTLTR